MGALLGIATQLLPQLIAVFAGDHSGSAQDKVVNAIKEATGQDNPDPAAAQNKIDADPDFKEKLRKDLEVIALEETKEQNRAKEQAQRIELEFQRIDVDDRERQREDDFRRYLRDLQDRQEARGTQMRLAEDHSPLAWVAPIMAFVLVLMIWYLLHGILNARDEVANKDVFNVVLGALVTAFTTVVAYYFGSSLGSSKKDEALKSGALMTNPKHHAAEADDDAPDSASAASAGGGDAGQGRPRSNPNGDGKTSTVRRPATGDLSLFRQKAPGIMRDLVRDLSLGDIHAAGILGNIGHECRGFLSLQEIKPIRGGRGGWGWCQWTNDRRQEFEQWANDRNLNPSSDEANYGFLLHELQGSQKASLRSLKQAPTVDAATTLFMHAFEKPAEEYAGVPDRLRYAKLALQDYRG